MPYYFYWSNGEEGYDADSIINLTAGQYTCVITDGIGCTDTIVVLLNEPQDSINVSAIVTTNYNGYDVSCYNSNDGAIDLLVTGGTGTYTYNWSDFNLSTDSAVGVSSGIYGVIVYDSNGCFDEDSISLNAPDELVIELTISPDTCSRGVGAADVSVSGGVLGYTYLWDSGEITANIFDVYSGNNNLTVTDANSCELAVNVLIDDLAKPTLRF